MTIKRRMFELLFRPGTLRRQAFFEKMFMFCLWGMNIGNGASIFESGERNAIEQINNKARKNPVFFDVGANVGEYTQELLKINPNATIHCFEPATETYRRLCENILDKRAVLNNLGVSDEPAEGLLYYDTEGSGLASLFNRQLDHFGAELSKSETVRLDTIDRYCEKMDIQYIDFLKMDIEGNELRALQGAERMLKSGSIEAIQIEFGGSNVDSRTFFRDFWNILHDKYTVYRILKDDLYEIKQYNECLEVFSCTNYMFIKK